MGAIANEQGCQTLPNNAALAWRRRVRLSGGYLAYAGANESELGVLDEASFATDTAASVALPKNGTVQWMTAAGAITQYADVYAAASGKISATVGSVYIGKALDAASGDGSEIRVLRLARPGGGDLEYAAVASSADVENTITETAFDKSKTIDGAGLKAGDVVHVLAQGRVTDNNSTDTLTIKLYLGTEEIVTTGAVDSADGDIWYIDAYIQIRTVGASGTLVATGVVANGVPGTVTAKPWMKAEATENISGSVAITVKATWSVAHADNEANLDMLIVEILKA